MSIPNIENFSEIDVINKIILPWLTKSGYANDELSQEHHIPVGRTPGVRADIVVLRNNKPSFVIDGKNPREDLNKYETQILSYGALLKVKYGVLCNGVDFRVYDIESDKIIWNKPVPAFPEFLNKKSMTQTRSGRISSSKIKSAENTLIQIEGIKQLSVLLHKCEDLIRDNDGLTGEDAFDQMTKMLFMKMWYEKTKPKRNPFSLQTIREAGGGNYVKGFLFNQVKTENPGLIESDEVLKLNDDSIMKIIEYFDDYTLLDTDVDIKGEAFEIFLGKTLTGNLGQFFTPRTIVDFAVKMVDPGIDSRDTNEPYLILDPSCGTGGFLISAFLHICKKIHSVNKSKRDTLATRLAEKQIFGADINPRLARVAKMNMFLHGDGHGGIYAANGLIDNSAADSYNKKFDLVITNPPFGNIDKDKKILNLFTLANGKKSQVRENLFIERCINCLRDGGVLAIVLPDGVLNNSKNYVRVFIKKHMIIDAVISLPMRSFKAVGANSKTSILFMHKKNSSGEMQGPIFMAKASEIGFERKTKLAKKIDVNDLDSILSEYKQYSEKPLAVNSTCTILRDSPPCFIINQELTDKRIDASYFYAEYMFELNKPSCRVKDVAVTSFVVNDRTKNPRSQIQYIEYGSIDKHVGDITDTATHYRSDAPGRAKYVVNKGDVICAKMLDSEKNVAIIPAELDDQIASNGFVILKPIAPITSEALFVLLRKNSTTEQIRWRAVGTIMPTISNTDYLNLKIPVMTKKEITSHTKMISQFNKEAEIRKKYLKQVFAD